MNIRKRMIVNNNAEIDYRQFEFDKGLEHVVGHIF
mgnify:CR=1 FL=1